MMANKSSLMIKPNVYDAVYWVTSKYVWFICKSTGKQPFSCLIDGKWHFVVVVFSNENKNLYKL